MAPEYNVVLAVLRTAAVARQDSVLAEKAASFLPHSLPEQSRAQVVEELLSRMREEKTLRDACGLNHWEEHGPEFLARLVTARNAAHRGAVGDFIAARHEEAMQFAFRITGSQDLAEKVLGQTYVELLEGRTTMPFFFRALKLNARNGLEKQANERNRFESLDSVLSWHRGGCDPERETEAQEFVSPHADDQDPLEVLIQREEAATVQREIGEARQIAENDRRFWWIRQQKWARELEIGASRNA